MTRYSICDIDGFCLALREAAAKSFTDNYSENLDDFISLKQIENILRKHSLGFDDNDDPIITEEIYYRIFDDIRDWIYGVGVAKLAAKDKIECAWDNELNEMIFWMKE